MKVYLFLEDQGIKGVDLSQPQNGNPGIGGTQFLFVTLAYELAMKDKYDITLVHYQKQQFPPKVKSETVETDIFDVLENEKPDIFVFHPNKDTDWYKRLDSLNIKCIAWVHNYISYKDASVLSNCSNVKAVIFVGKQQYDRYIDHNIIYKSTYIYNFVPKIEIIRKPEFKLWVTFIGSLTYPKGFHWISKCWKKVVEQVPGAELHVIGSGNLYSRNSKNGSYGIASEDYESQIIPDLVDYNGKILESVKFHGNLGAEKFDILENTAVGIMNPSGETETFGLGAVEMQQVGVPVISRRKFGLLDTISNNCTGILIDNINDLQEAIVTLLTDKEKNQEYGNNARKFVESKFNKDKIIDDWTNLLNLVYSAENYKCDPVIPSDFLSIDLKWARIIIARIKKIPFLKWIPSVGEVCECIREIKRK